MVKILKEYPAYLAPGTGWLSSVESLALNILAISGDLIAFVCQDTGLAATAFHVVIGFAIASVDSVWSFAAVQCVGPRTTDE